MVKEGRHAKGSCMMMTVYPVLRVELVAARLAARVAELEEQLASEKASQNSPRPAPAPKVLKLITLKFIIFRDK